MNSPTLRGGAWYDDRWFACCAYRIHVSPASRDISAGFRCVVPCEQLSKVVLCGGSWLELPLDCRVSSRDWLHPVNRYDFLGFRPAVAAFITIKLPPDALNWRGWSAT